MSIKIKRVDLAKDGKSVKFGFSQSAASKDGGIVESDYKAVTVHKGAHEDFVAAFVKMAPHLLYATELAKVTVTSPDWFTNYEFLNDDRFEGISVTGIKIVDKDESKIRLIGEKVTSNGDVCSIISPIIDLHTDDPSRYVLQSVIADNFKLFLAEASQYWDKQKYAPNPQQELELK